MNLKNRHRGATYFWAGFLVPAVLVITGFIIIGVWPAGDGTVLIIDSIHQYLPFYTDFHEKLAKGSSLFYSFSAGLGYNFWATYAYYLASPLNFLIVLFPTENVCDFMDLMILLKIAFCGGTFSWYLHRRYTRSGALPVAFGTMYALSFFIIGYYFNLMWLDSIAMLPIIMCGIEKICGIGHNGVMSGRSDGRMYCAALAYGLWCNYYIGFMLCLFSALYFIVCNVISLARSIKAFLFRILRFLVYSLLAGGIGALVLLPAYKALTLSESMESNKFPSAIKFYDSFIDLVMTHFAGIKPINIADTQVGLNAYCGVSIFCLVLLFALDRKIAMRDRIVRLSLAGFFLLSFSLNYLNYMWHGFHQQNGLPNRFAFIYIAVILTMSFDALKDLKKTPVFRLIIALSAPVVFAIAAYFLKLGKDYEGDSYPRHVYIITALLLSGYFAILLFIRLGPLRKTAAFFIISAALVTEACSSAVYGIIQNDSVTRSIYLADQKSYKELMSEIADNTWYRSEVDAQRMRNVSLFCGANSIVMFNSTMQHSVTEFCDALGIESRTNKNGYNGVTRLMNDVFGIKYVLSAHGTGSTFYGFDMLDSDGNLTVYENEDALSIGFLVNSEITQWTTLQGNPIEIQDSFVELATGHEAIYKLDRYLDIESGVENAIRIPEGKQVYIYLPSRAKEVILTTPEYSKTYTTYTDHLYVIDSCDGDYEATFTATLNSGSSLRAAIYTCPDESVKEVQEMLAESPLENVSAEGSHLSGTVNANRDGELLITIPYDVSWICRIDGEVVKADCIGECLMGIPLEEGQHDIELSYIPEGIGEGAVISLISVALFALMCYLSLIRKRAEDARRRMTRQARYESLSFASPAGRSADNSKGGPHDFPEGGPHDFPEGEMSVNLKGGWAPVGTQRVSGLPIKAYQGLTEDVIEDIIDLAGEEQVLEREPMKFHTTFRIGGVADIFVSPRSEKSLLAVVDYCRSFDVPFLVIGNGSNLLVSDDGYRGVIIHIGRELSSISAEEGARREQAGAGDCVSSISAGIAGGILSNGAEITGGRERAGDVGGILSNGAEITMVAAQAGASLSSIAHWALKESLTLMEPLSGIPGSLGGALSMNAGAYGREMKDIVSSARCLFPDGTVRDLDRVRMGFGYRSSIVQRENLIVLSSVLRLQEGNKDEILSEMNMYRDKRQEKQPLDMPSAGSMFKRPEGHYAGALIESAGLRGYCIGGAKVSEKHCGFIVNTGNATARDVLSVINDIQRIVYEKSGIMLEREVKLVGFRDEDGLYR